MPIPSQRCPRLHCRPICRHCPAGCHCPSVSASSLSHRALDYPARPDSSSAPATDSADFADFVGAADSNTAPTGSKPASFCQRVPWMNFPAWPGQSSPCSSKNLRCRFSPTNLQLHKSALPIPPRWHGCRCPNVRTNSLFCQALDYPVYPDSPSADSVDFADFVGADDSNTAPCVQTSIVSSALPLTILTL